MCRSHARHRPVRSGVTTATEQHQVPLLIEYGTEGRATGVR